MDLVQVFGTHIWELHSSSSRVSSLASFQLRADRKKSVIETYTAFWPMIRGALSPWQSAYTTWSLLNADFLKYFKSVIPLFFFSSSQKIYFNSWLYLLLAVLISPILLLLYLVRSHFGFRLWVWGFTEYLVYCQVSIILCTLQRFNISELSLASVYFPFSSTWTNSASFTVRDSHKITCNVVDRV